MLHVVQNIVPTMRKIYISLINIFFLLQVIAVSAQNVPPTVITKPSVCKGAPLDLNTLITNAGSEIYELRWWRPINYGGIETWEGLQSDQLVIQNPGNGAKFRLTYEFNDGRSGRFDITVKVFEQPVIVPMDDVSICEGSEIQLSIKSSIDADSIWWELLETGETFANNSFTTPSKTTENNDYQMVYRVYGLNTTCGIMTQNDVKIDVTIPLTGSSLKVNNTYSFCTGETVDLTKLLYFTIQNARGKEYSYYHTDSEVSNYRVTWNSSQVPNPSAYTITGATTLTAYVTAQLSIQNSCSPVSRTFSNQPVQVQINIEGTSPALSHVSVGSTNNYYPYVVCQGDSVVISVLSGTCGNIEDVKWVSPAIPQSNRISANDEQWDYYWHTASSTQFKAQITTINKTNGARVVIEATLEIDVKGYPKLVAIPDTSACSNQPVTIDLNGLLDMNSFLGSPDWGGINPVITNPTTSNTYYVKATSAYQCQDMSSYDVRDSIKLNVGSLELKAMQGTTICSGSSVTLTAQSNGAIRWSTSIEGPSIPATQSPSKTTMYYVTATNECGSEIDSVLITVDEAFSLTLSNDATICKQQSVTLQAYDFKGDSILWNVDNKWIKGNSITVTPNQTTTYTAKAYSGTCEATSSVTFTVLSIPYLKAMDDLTVCSGQAVVLTADSDTPVKWNVSNTTVYPVSDTSFYVSATNGVCTSYDTVNIKVGSPASVTAMDDLFVCYGETVTLSVKNSQGSISWNVPQTTFKATQTAEYIVTAKSNGCADATDKVVITVNDSLYMKPDALPRYRQGVSYNVHLETNAQTPNYSVIAGNLPNSLFLTSSGTISGTVPEGSGLENGTFTVEITDINGCKTDKDYTLEGESVIPEVFTPNGDGINDTFMKGYHVIIYNRLGVKLFEGRDGWDGTFKGSVLPPDTYFYTVTIGKGNGQSEKKSGAISIVKRY